MTGPDDFEAIFELDALTNPVLRDDAGDLELVPPEDRIGGPGTSIIMAAFTHRIPNGNRFPDGSYGVFHAANDLHTANAETTHNRERFQSSMAEAHVDPDMRVHLVDFDGGLHDLRGRKARPAARLPRGQPNRGPASGGTAVHGRFKRDRP